MEQGKGIRMGREDGGENLNWCVLVGNMTDNVVD